MTNEQDVYPEHRASLLNRTACGLAEVVGVQAYQLPAAFIEQSALAVSRILRHTPHDIAQALGNAEAAQRTIEALGARARAQLTYSEHIIVESVKALRAIVRADGALRVQAERTEKRWYDAPIERDHHGREYPLRDSDGNYLGIDENTI